MVLPLIDPAADHNRGKRIQQQQMVLQRRDDPVDHDQADIFDIAIDRVEQEQALDIRRVCLHGIEDRGKIHQQEGGDIVQILRIPEKDEHGGKDQPDTDVEENQAHDRIGDHEKPPGEGDPVYGDKQEEDDQRDGEIDDRRYVLCQQEYVFGHVDLRKDGRVAHQRAHAAGGGFLEKRKRQVPGEQVHRVVRYVPGKELGEYDPHDQQLQQRREQSL